MQEESLAKTVYWKTDELAREVTFLQLAFAKAVIMLDENEAARVLKHTYKTFGKHGVTQEQAAAHTAVMMADLFGIKSNVQHGPLTNIPEVRDTVENIKDNMMRSGWGTAQHVGVAAGAYDKFRTWQGAAP